MLTPCPECGRRLRSEVESIGAFRTVVFFDDENDARVERCPGCGLRLQSTTFEPAVGIRQRITEGKTAHILTNAEHEATLTWLEDALREALAGRKMALVGYLEAVLEDVMLELELDSPPPPLSGLPQAAPPWVEDACSG